MSELAKTYDMSGIKQPTIDEQEVPWFIAEEGPMTQPLNEHCHILWLPILVQGAAIPSGRPNGDPINDSEGASE